MTDKDDAFSFARAISRRKRKELQHCAVQPQQRKIIAHTIRHNTDRSEGCAAESTYRNRFRTAHDVIVRCNQLRGDYDSESKARILPPQVPLSEVQPHLVSQLWKWSQHSCRCWGAGMQLEW